MKWLFLVVVVCSASLAAAGCQSCEYAGPDSPAAQPAWQELTSHDEALAYDRALDAGLSHLLSQFEYSSRRNAVSLNNERSPRDPAPNL